MRIVTLAGAFGLLLLAACVSPEDRFVAACVREGQSRGKCACLGEQIGQRLSNDAFAVVAANADQGEEGQQRIRERLGSAGMSRLEDAAKACT